MLKLTHIRTQDSIPRFLVILSEIRETGIKTHS
jgi:hypothetical protein